MLEELAAEFSLKTKDAIERIQALEKADRLSGVFDDRGKFIYVTKDEMEKVSNWLIQKGRINRSDLVAACNRHVRMNPTAEDRAKIVEENNSAVAALDSTMEEDKEA